MLLDITALSAPALLAFAGLFALLRPGEQRFIKTCVVLIAASISLLFTLNSAMLLVIGHKAMLLPILIDNITVILSCLIAFVGLIVLRYSTINLREEKGGDRFLGWMTLTLCAVHILVQAGTLWLFALAWLATSLFLQRLLIFYPHRPLAIRAARKKWLLARAGDICLTVAFILLAYTFGSGHIATISAQAGQFAGSASTTLAAALIAAAAILKSAQFPFHGWLTEVMEAPTPVSALLHAGVINAGGFLLIRFSDVLVGAPGVLAVLVAIGGFTALIGSLVMLTQPAIKTALAWSTIAQMGFMIMQCGLGLFAFALLHIVAHSFYKAHSFLSSGGVVERVTAAKRPGRVAVPSLRSVALAFLCALLVFTVVAVLFEAWNKPPQAVALGIILVLGIAYMFAQGLADAAPGALTRRTIVYAAVMTVAYFALQQGVTLLVGDAVAPVPFAGPLEWVLIVLALTTFSITAFAQSMFPHWADHPAAAGLRVHLQNGLYANLLFDLALRSYAEPKGLRS